MEKLILKIDSKSKIPKYKQIIDQLVFRIESGELPSNYQLPSINELSEEYNLSRGTVEKAYIELRERNNIVPVKGRGYFVHSAASKKTIKVLLIFNKLSTYKKSIYYSILSTLGNCAIVDLQIHHYNKDLFIELIDKNIDSYNYFVIMPHFYQEEIEVSVLDILKKIEKHKLILLDKNISDLKGDFGAVYQDFENDIYDALHEAVELVYKYDNLQLIFPSGFNYPIEISRGVKRFCLDTKIKFSIIESMDTRSVEKNTVYIVVEESDLVDVIKKCRIQNLSLGKDVGLISYNDTVLKEILAEGITVVSTDFEQMGKSVARMILSGERQKIKNPFSLIKRNTL